MSDDPHLATAAPSSPAHEAELAGPIVDGDGEIHPDPAVAGLLRYTRLGADQLERAERIHGRLEVAEPLVKVIVDLGMLTEEEVHRAERQRRAGMTVADILEEDGVLTRDARVRYDQARTAAPRPTDRAALVTSGLVSEEEYLRALGIKLGIPYQEPRVGEVDTSLYDQVSFNYLVGNVALPVSAHDGELTVILATPEDDAVAIELERTFGMRVRRLACTRDKIEEALRTLERLRGKAADQDQFKVQYHVVDRPDNAEVDEGGQEAVQLVDYLLSRAIQLKASDLHIEPSPSRIRVRVRIDGVLQQLTDLPIDFAPRVAARIKILSRMDVTEKRLHQDGKIHVRVGGQDTDIRVSTYVSTFGETIVMRLLDRDKGIIPIDRIGFQPKAYQSLTDVVLRSSSGLVLVVGPTGSGKTTTLYSFVDHANDPAKKVITCEDPVEYVIDGIIQCSVNPRSGPTFADSLRAIVRQDPDTIVVGEIRDQETAALAVEAALTGHKVYSTYHTEEAVGAFVRLLEMGIESFLVGSTVSAVVAQRLVRRLCDECKAPARPALAKLRFVAQRRGDVDGHELLGPVGCTECHGTGYSGRIAIHEVLVPDDAFRQAVMDHGSSDELRSLARALPGFLTMMEDGLHKVSQGLTSIDEIIESVPRDQGARPLPEIERAVLRRRS